MIANDAWMWLVILSIGAGPQSDSNIGTYIHFWSGWNNWLVTKCAVTARSSRAEMSAGVKVLPNGRN